MFLEPTLAIIHAALAQAFFALMVSIAFFTSTEGREQPHRTTASDATRVRNLGLLTIGGIYVQLIFGAMLRHLGIGLGAHIIFAGVVTILIVALAGTILRHHPDRPRLVGPVTLLSGLLIVQLALGLGSYLGRFTTLAVSVPVSVVAALTTTHVATGALMLATGLVLALRIDRMLAPRVAVVSREFIPAHSADRSEGAPA